MARTTNINIGNDNDNAGNIINSFNSYKSDEDVQILRWLSPLEPNNRHEGVRANRFTGVGDWLLETPEFRAWRGGESGVARAVLFCSGNPGVGKTHLSSLVIDSLCDQEGKENIAIAGLYCDFPVQQEQTLANMMGAILKQLVGRGEIPNYLREAFQKGKTEIGGRKLLLPDLMKMLKTAIASLPQVFICIDALDEFLPEHLPELLKLLGDIVWESPMTRIFLTGRPHIRGDIQRHFTELVVIPISPNTDDIRSYLEMRLDRDTDPEAMTDDLRADIIRVILEKISDIFLLVSLNMDAILGVATIRKRRKKLEAMVKGNGLGDAYTATLTRLKAQKGDKSIMGLEVLMWVLYSERPLQAEELCHALGVEVGSTDLDIENVPAMRTLLASCLGLVTVEASSSTVRLLHYTLKEHLSSDATLFHSPHSVISEVCLTYLNFKCVRGLSPTCFSAPVTMPFVEYASHYWGGHVKKGMTENVETLALKLLDRFDEHISAQLILLRRNGDRDPIYGFLGGSGPAGFTGLHAVSFLGVDGIVTAVLDMKEWDVNATDITGNTALTWAARCGHQEIVNVLLKQGDIKPNQADTGSGRTPLSWAALRGHEGVVKMLLERADVNPNQADTFGGRTQLRLAARHGSEGVVRMLSGWRDVNPKQADARVGRAPLSWAALCGHEGIVKMLLERKDTNPNLADTRYGRTPLWLAAKGGHEGVVKMLLERADVNLDQVDLEDGRTLLSWAAWGGYEGVVKILLKREDVNPNQVDTKSGRTPLWWAALCGHEGVVKMLLEREDVNPNQADTKYGRTPLSWAVEYGHEGVVKMLLEQKDVSTVTPDCENQTPLLRALSNGHERIAKMLLDHDSTNSDPADRAGWASPPPSTGRGDECVVGLQLRGDLDTHVADVNNQHALQSPDPDEREPVSGLKDFPSNSTDSDLSPTQQPKLSQPPPMWPLSFWYLRGKADTHPDNTRSTLSLRVHGYFTIAFFVCLFAFLLYILLRYLKCPYSINDCRVSD